VILAHRSQLLVDRRPQQRRERAARPGPREFGRGRCPTGCSPEPRNGACADGGRLRYGWGGVHDLRPVWGSVATLDVDAADVAESDRCLCREVVVGVCAVSESGSGPFPGIADVAARISGARRAFAGLAAVVIA